MSCLLSQSVAEILQMDPLVSRLVDRSGESSGRQDEYDGQDVLEFGNLARARVEREKEIELSDVQKVPDLMLFFDEAAREEAEKVHDRAEQEEFLGTNNGVNFTSP